jgi:hypothetical protein
MGFVRGNPPVLVALFFGAAVILMGGLYALVPMALKTPSLSLVAVSIGLGASMLFCMVVIARIFWVLARNTYGKGSARASNKQ